MEVVYTHCCGLDVHKKTVVACCITRNTQGEPVSETRTYSTMTPSLLEMSDWLADQRITHVAMESTGDYWKPIYNILEGRFALLVVNAKHIKAVPGRKTDVKDAQWIAELLQHGLLRASFIPPAPQRILRDMTRHRNNFVRERVNLSNRLQRVLEDANIKASSVATDILGVSGRLMLNALVQGETNPEKMADLSRGRLRDKKAEMESALTGMVKPHHRLILGELLRQVDSINESIACLDDAIEDACRVQGSSGGGPSDESSSPGSGASKMVEATPDGVIVEESQTLAYDAAVGLLDTIPGIARKGAQIIVAEIGTDMSRFPTAGHLSAWAGVAPGNNESGGKRLSGRSRKGNKALKKALVQVAHAAARTRDTYFNEQYHRLAARRGAKRAAMAVAHSILVTAYHMLTRQEPYRELRPGYLDKKRSEKTAKFLVNRLQRLGYDVTLNPQNAVVPA